jgi:hypothetical protein
MRQHDPLRDAKSVAQGKRVPARPEGEVEQLIGFGYIEEAELGDVGRVEEASEEVVQRAVPRVVNWRCERLRGRVC